MIRQLIREMILHEDMKGFSDRVDHIDYVGTSSDPTFENEESLPMKPMAREVKRAWAAEADHEFMKTLTKVHWFQEADQIRKFMSLSGKNEISVMGYLPEKEALSSNWSSYGAIIQGRVTLAANDMDSLFTGYHGFLHSDITRKYKSSGVPRRANFFMGNSRAYILDRSTFEDSNSYSCHNELVVDNWKVLGFVIDTNERGWLGLACLMMKFGLPIYDMRKNPITPKLKDILARN
jgi:hypothetical protein